MPLFQLCLELPTSTSTIPTTTTTCCHHLSIDKTMSSDGEYEYEYSDEEDYVLEDDEDTMEWNPVAKGSSDNPNAPPMMTGT